MLKNRILFFTKNRLKQNPVFFCFFFGRAETKKKTEKNRKKQNSVFSLFFMKNRILFLVILTHHLLGAPFFHLLPPFAPLASPFASLPPLSTLCLSLPLHCPPGRSSAASSMQHAYSSGGSACEHVRNTCNLKPFKRPFRGLRGFQGTSPGKSHEEGQEDRQT